MMFMNLKNKSSSKINIKPLNKPDDEIWKDIWHTFLHTFLSSETLNQVHF